MSDTKDDGSSEKNEELRKRNQKRLERSLMPEGVGGSGYSRREPVAAEKADRTPDWRVWSYISEPKLWECVALWSNIDPFKVKISGYRVREDLRCRDPIFEESREFDERLYIASENLHRTLRCTAIDQYSVLESRVSLRQFAAWAREIGRDAPAELLAMADEPVVVKADRGSTNAATATRETVQTPSDTKNAKIAELTQELDSLRERVAELEQAAQKASEKAKPLQTKQRQSALKLIIGMAIKGYQYDPAAVRNDAITKISHDIESLGISLDPDTVRNWLRMATEVLPSKAKKT